MSPKYVVFWNSVIWGVVVFASAVVLKGSDDFVPMLLVLLCGAAGTSALLGTRRSDRS